MHSSQNSFLSPKCEVRAADDRGGYTVVAREPIAKGELIVVWSGTLVDGAELVTLPAPRQASLATGRGQPLSGVSHRL